MLHSLNGSPSAPAIRLGALLLTALLAGCLDVPEAGTEVSVTEALAFEPIGRGMQARLDTTMIAIRDAATWTAYQDSLHPLQPFKAVDFEREMVLLVALPVPSGGYDVRFQIVEKTDIGLAAGYLLFTPGDDCRVTVGASVVFQAVRLARTDEVPHFTGDREAYRCTEPR